MKMPAILNNNMFAPCGMNCQVCYVHLEIRKYGHRCNGCLSKSEKKPAHCHSCKIKNCVDKKRVSYCFACDDFPCKLVENLERSYIKRYNVSLIQNSLLAKEKGLTEFMALQQKLWACPVCGGTISLHDQTCSDCKTPHKSSS